MARCRRFRGTSSPCVFTKKKTLLSSTLLFLRFPGRLESSHEGHGRVSHVSRPNAASYLFLESRAAEETFHQKSGNMLDECNFEEDLLGQHCFW